MKKAALLFTLSLVATVFVRAAYASAFGPYTSVSNEVSVSYAQVKRDTWTWKFLNSSDTTTITHMTFKYKDKDGEHSDILPGDLEPGVAFGGWSAFAASSRPTITIKEIKREAR